MKITSVVVSMVAIAATTAEASDLVESIESSLEARQEHGSLSFLKCANGPCTKPNRSSDCALKCLNRMDVREGSNHQIFVQATGNSPSTCPPCNTVSGSGFIHSSFTTDRFGRRRKNGEIAIIDFGLRRETCEFVYPNSGINAERNCNADPACEFDFHRHTCVQAPHVRDPPKQRLELELSTVGVRSGIRGLRAVGVKAIYSNKRGRQTGESDDFLFEVNEGTVLGRSAPPPTRSPTFPVEDPCRTVSPQQCRHTVGNNGKVCEIVSRGDGFVCTERRPHD